MPFLHVDLCCGLGGWQQPFKEAEGWRSVGLDVGKGVSPDVVADVRELPLTACEPDLLTLSPPCTQFARWMLPWLEEPDPSMELVEACLDAVDHLDPRYWVLENSRGLHQYWEEAVTHFGAYYLWGNFPPVDVGVSWKGKMQTSGEQPDERAKVPYELAETFRIAVESWG